MERFLLAIDQSTSGTKAIIFDEAGRLVRRHTVEHTQYYPHPGWVEHDATEIYQKTLRAVAAVLDESGMDRRRIAALAVTNQRETVLIWDKITGKPVYNAVVWQCQRAGPLCKTLVEQGYGPVVRQKTGLILAPYFSAPKLRWILDHVPGVRADAEAGRLLLGTMDTWLIWNLTGGKVHATDLSNASRTLLFNIQTLQWDPQLLEIFTIPASMLPEVRASDANFGFTSLASLLPQEIPIAGVAGDSHAALFGQNCFEKGMAKATYGTGSSIMMNIGDRPLASESGLVTAIAWGLNGRVDYVFEGNVNCTGDTLKWLVDGAQLIASPGESGPIASTVNDNDGVYLVPAFVGLGAPYWDSEARASITGISRGTKKAHLVRAALESIAYQIKDIIDLMIAESGIQLRELRVDGGPAKNDLLMKFQADMLDVTVVRNKTEELSALGAALIAGLTTGIWKDEAEIRALRVQDAVFESRMNASTRDELYRGWKEAVRRSLSSF